MSVKVFLFLAWIWVVKSQMAVISIVYSGIPRIKNTPKISRDLRTDRLSGDVTETGSRQQYSLGLEYLKRYASVYNNSNLLKNNNLLMLTKSSKLDISSSQSLGRALTLNKKGPELSNTNPTTWDPPYRASALQKQVNGDSALPKNMAILGSRSFQMSGMLVSDDIDKYCPRASSSIEEKQQKFEALTQGPMSQLLLNLNITDFQASKRFIMFQNLHHYLEATLRNTGSLPHEYKKLTSDHKERIKRAAILTYLGSFDDSSLPLIRLKTKDIFSKIHQVLKGFPETGLPEDQTKAVIIHPGEDNFITMMGLTNLTSRECNRDLISPDNIKASNTSCENFPDYSSSINFEFYYGKAESMDMDGWYVKANYNGATFKICKSSNSDICLLPQFISELRHSLWSANEEYYCDMAYLTSQEKKSQTYLIAWMFISIFILLVSVSAFFIVKTTIKIERMASIYKTKQSYFNHPQGEFYMDADRSLANNSSIL